MNNNKSPALTAAELREFEHWAGNKFIFRAESFLWAAACEGEVKFARHLLSQGVGHDALFRAIKKGNALAAQTLIDAGIDLDRRNKRGETALMVAATSGKREIAEKLIDAGADVNIRKQNGATALILSAAYNDQHNIVTRLLDAGANPDFLCHDKDARGWAYARSAVNSIHVLDEFERRAKEPLCLPPPEKKSGEDAEKPAAAAASSWRVIRENDADMVIHNIEEGQSGLSITRIFDFHAGILLTRVTSPGTEPSIIKEEFSAAGQELITQAKEKRAAAGVTTNLKLT